MKRRNRRASDVALAARLRPSILSCEMYLCVRVCGSDKFSYKKNSTGYEKLKKRQLTNRNTKTVAAPRLRVHEVLLL